MALSWSTVGRVLDDCLAELADARCVHCDFPVVRGALCVLCAPPRPLRGPRCGRCDGAVVESVPRCGRCLAGFGAGLDAVRSAGLYLGPYRTLLVRGKRAGRRELVEATAPLVWAGAARGTFPVDVIVPVPMHRRRFAERGFNAAEIVARQLASAWDGPPVAMLLHRVKHEEPLSTGMSRSARRAAVRGAFSARKGVRVPERVCLVDDVLTTGATLSACARALRRAGAKAVYGWSLLRAPEPGGAPVGSPARPERTVSG